MGAFSLGRAFGQISAPTAVSRVLGFVRDVCFAVLLGAGPAADAFVVALKLPNMFRRMTAEGAMASAFVPAFAGARQGGGERTAMELAAETQTTLCLGLCALLGLGEIFMPQLVALLAPGFAATPERMDAAIRLGRVTFCYLPMISLVAFWSAIANASNRFLAGAAMPIIFNICLIAGALAIPLASGWIAVERAMPLAVALLVAGALQLVAMAFVLVRCGVMPGLGLPRFAAPIRRMWRHFSVATLGGMATQINQIVDLVLASLLPVGAISWLYYADRLTQLPLGLVGVALATALLPQLSALYRGGDGAAAERLLGHAVHLAAFLALPAAVGLFLVSNRLTGGLFEYGAFTGRDAAMSAAALGAYAVGLPAHVLAKLLQTSFYAQGRPGFVLGASLAAVGANIAMSLALMPVLGHVGLALATSISGFAGAGLLAAGLLRAGCMPSMPWGPLFRIALCVAVMAAALFWLEGVVSGLAAPLGLGALVCGGAIAYFGAATLFRAMPGRVERG